MTLPTKQASNHSPQQTPPQPQNSWCSLTATIATPAGHAAATHQQASCNKQQLCHCCSDNTPAPHMVPAAVNIQPTAHCIMQCPAAGNTQSHADKLHLVEGAMAVSCQQAGSVFNCSCGQTLRPQCWQSRLKELTQNKTRTPAAAKTTQVVGSRALKTTSSRQSRPENHKF
jgi:hypothetical protein